MTLPFFGDQAFWGEMCRRAGVGPAPVAIENLTQQRLLDGLHMLMQPSVGPTRDLDITNSETSAPVAKRNLAQQRLLDGLNMLMQPLVRPQTPKKSPACERP